MMPENKNSQLARPFLKLLCNAAEVSWPSSGPFLLSLGRNKTLSQAHRKKNKKVLYKTAIDDEVLVVERIEVNM